MVVLLPDILTAIYERRGKAPEPRPGSDDTLRTTAALVDVDDATYTATVSVWGSEPIEGVPAVPSVYTGVTSVQVLLQGGRPVQVLGPASDAELTPAERPPAAVVSSVRTATRTVSPVGAGTWRTDSAAWDRHNGATKPVYQGTSLNGHGPLRGLAWYGDQVTALGASTITGATLTVVSNGSPGAGAWTATIQGCASGSRPAGAPTFTGDTFTVSVPSGSGGRVTVAIPSSVREAMRTGAVRSLGLVGSPYGGTTSTPPSWSIAFDYEVTA